MKTNNIINIQKLLCRTYSEINVKNNENLLLSKKEILTIKGAIDSVIYSEDNYIFLRNVNVQKILNAIFHVLKIQKKLIECKKNKLIPKEYRDLTCEYDNNFNEVIKSLEINTLDSYEVYETTTGHEKRRTYAIINEEILDLINTMAELMKDIHNDGEILNINKIAFLSSTFNENIELIKWNLIKTNECINELLFEIEKDLSLSEIMLINCKEEDKSDIMYQRLLLTKLYKEITEKVIKKERSN